MSAVAPIADYRPDRSEGLLCANTGHGSYPNCETAERTNPPSTRTFTSRLLYAWRQLDLFGSGSDLDLMERPRTQFAKAGDIHIAYQVFGNGPIDLLYAQGWLTNVEYAWESPDYARFLSKLGRFARVIFFDKRGTGMSDRNVGVHTLEERSQDINAVMEAVGSEKVALFGNSEGGAICSYFAATYPQRVSHLILYGSRPRYAWAPDYPTGTTEEEIEASISDLIANWGGAFELDTGAPSVVGDRAAAEWFAAYFRYSASPGAAEQITRMNYDIDYSSLLTKSLMRDSMCRGRFARGLCHGDATFGGCSG